MQNDTHCLVCLSCAAAAAAASTTTAGCGTGAKEWGQSCESAWLCFSEDDYATSRRLSSHRLAGSINHRVETRSANAARTGTHCHCRYWEFVKSFLPFLYWLTEADTTTPWLPFPSLPNCLCPVDKVASLDLTFATLSCTCPLSSCPLMVGPVKGQAHIDYSCNTEWPPLRCASRPQITD